MQRQTAWNGTMDLKASVMMLGLHYGHGLPVVHVSLKRTGTCDIIVYFVSFWTHFDTLCDGLSRWLGQNGSKKLECGSWVQVPQNWTKFHYGLVRVYQVLPWIPLHVSRFLQVLLLSARSVQVSLSSSSSNRIYKSLIQKKRGVTWTQSRLWARLWFRVEGKHFSISSRDSTEDSIEETYPSTCPLKIRRM